MSKLAKEMLDHLDVHADLFGGLDPGYVQQQRAFLESIIAAKLEPLRDVLYVGLGAAMLVTPRSEPVIDKIKAAIESLSEEE